MSDQKGPDKPHSPGVCTPPLAALQMPKGSFPFRLGVVAGEAVPGPRMVPFTALGEALGHQRKSACASICAPMHLLVPAPAQPASTPSQSPCLSTNAHMRPGVLCQANHAPTLTTERTQACKRAHAPCIQTPARPPTRAWSCSTSSRVPPRWSPSWATSGAPPPSFLACPAGHALR